MNEGKILLVEDEIDLSELYRYVLQKAGFTVLAANNGEDGLKLARDNPDARLMLLDIMLPKMHGIDVLKRLKEDSTTQKLPILLLSNLTEENILQQALELGAAGYIVKVRFTPQQVVEKVKEFITPKDQPPK